MQEIMLFRRWHEDLIHPMDYAIGGQDVGFNYFDVIDRDIFAVSHNVQRGAVQSRKRHRPHIARQNGVALMDVIEQNCS